MITALAVTLLLTATPVAETKQADPWRISGAVDPIAFASSGFSFRFGLRPAPIPRWHFGLGVSRWATPGFIATLDPKNQGWHISFPLVFEAFGEYAFGEAGDGLVLGASLGQLHFHAEHRTIVGLHEHDRYQLSPSVGYQRTLIKGLKLKPWLSVGIPLGSGADQGEIEVDPAERTYSEWPTLIRVGAFLAYEL